MHWFCDPDGASSGPGLRLPLVSTLGPQSQEVRCWTSVGSSLPLSGTNDHRPLAGRRGPTPQTGAWTGHGATEPVTMDEYSDLAARLAVLRERLVHLQGHTGTIIAALPKQEWPEDPDARERARRWKWPRAAKKKASNEDSDAQTEATKKK